MGQYPYSMLPAHILLLLVVGSAAAYDKYQDALDKYAKWQQKFGLPTPTTRRERNSADLKQVSVNSRRDLTGPIFVPHRPQDAGGRQFLVSPLASLEQEVVSPEVVRNTRNHQDRNEECKHCKNRDKYSSSTDWSWWCRVCQLSWDSSLQTKEEIPALWEEEERHRDSLEQEAKTVTMDTPGPSNRQSYQRVLRPPCTSVETQQNHGTI